MAGKRAGSSLRISGSWPETGVAVGAQPEGVVAPVVERGSAVPGGVEVRTGVGVEPGEVVVAVAGGVPVAEGVATAVCVGGIVGVALGLGEEVLVAGSVGVRVGVALGRGEGVKVGVAVSQGSGVGVAVTVPPQSGPGSLTWPSCADAFPA